MKKRKKKGLPVWAVVVGVLLLIGAISPSKSAEKARTSVTTREAPAAVATAEPTPSPVPTPSPEPTATPYRIRGIDPDRTVYVSRQGVIHFKSDCSGMKYYETMTMEQADAAGYTEICDHCR